MATVKETASNIITLEFHQERKDADYGSCLWAVFNFDLNRYAITVMSDCGNYSYGWVPTPKSESFMHLMSRVDKGYLLDKITNRIVDAEYAEFDRQASLSDYDWSVEQIDRTLSHWARIYNISPDVQEACRERLLSFDNVEDLEVRLCAGNIEWKYTRKQRWTALQI